MSNDQFIAALEAVIEQHLSQINTTVPGTIVSFDAARNRAVVRPVLSKRLPDGSVLPAPAIHEVPVQWMRFAGGGVTLPLRPGDGVQLHFSQRSLEGWLSGSSDAPEDPRQFDISDAVAVPGLVSNIGAPVDPDNLVLEFGGASIRITPEGKVIITAPGGIDLVAPQTNSTGNILSGAIGLATHSHPGTGTPTP